MALAIKFRLHIFGPHLKIEIEMETGTHRKNNLPSSLMLKIGFSLACNQGYGQGYG